MSAEPSGPAVVAFGAGDAVPDGARPLAERLRRIASDRRALLAVTVLAGVAGCAALVAPWYATMLPLGAPDPVTGNQTDRLVEFHLGDLGAMATGCLLALLLLAVASVLALTGTPAVSAAARRSGLVVAGGSVAMLVALTMTIDNYVARSFFFLYEEEYEVDNRSGLTAAFLAVLLAALALYLSRRTSAAEVHAETAAGPERGWQPPRPARDETAAEIAAAAPLDLTVQPARPFAHPDPDEGRTR